MEIIMPETVRAVRDAIAEGDDAALTRFGRFLGPIGERIAVIANPAERARTDAVLGDACKAYVNHGVSVCKRDGAPSDRNGRL